MTVSGLDTLELVKDLKSAGFTDEQAEAVTRAVKRAQDLDFSDFATKVDLAALRTDIAMVSAKIDGVEARFGGFEGRFSAFEMRLTNFATKAELADLRTDIIKWVVTIALGQGALIVALLKLLPGSHL
ncbi:MAG TPA: hypothetical protein VHW66_07880 [Stellaceae bacterium]|jgi:hypothetical protein|nr:hypothetical protein [Stellaceae bacterium]